MKLVKELQYWNKPGDRKYQILEEAGKFYFSIRNTNNLKLPNSVLEYSQQENDVVCIYECGDWIVTEYMTDYQPVIIRGSCNFYSDLRIREYNKYFKKPENSLGYYKRVVKAHLDFMWDTGWQFTDRTGTNVLVNRDFSDLRIIDVCSLEQISDKNEIIFTVSEFFYPKEWHKATGHKHGLIKPDINHIKEIFYAITTL